MGGAGSTRRRRGEGGLRWLRARDSSWGLAGLRGRPFDLANVAMRASISSAAAAGAETVATGRCVWVLVEVEVDVDC